MPCVPITRNAILQLLENEGPMTAAEITEALGFTRKRVDGCITTARQDHGTKFFRISSFRRQQGNGGREAPVYTLGPGSDAKRPIMHGIEEHRKRNARYRDKNRALINLRNQKRRHGTVNPFAQLFARKAT